MNTKKFSTRFYLPITSMPQMLNSVGMYPCKRSRHRRAFSSGKIEVGAAHEIMAAGASQLAFFIDQFMSALQAVPPMFARKAGLWLGAGSSGTFSGICLTARAH